MDWDQQGFYRVNVAKVKGFSLAYLHVIHFETSRFIQQRTHVGAAHQKSKEENYEPITAAEKKSITAEHRVSLVYAA